MGVQNATQQHSHILKNVGMLWLGAVQIYDDRLFFELRKFCAPARFLSSPKKGNGEVLYNLLRINQRSCRRLSPNNQSCDDSGSSCIKINQSFATVLIDSCLHHYNYQHELIVIKMQ